MANHSRQEEESRPLIEERQHDHLGDNDDVSGEIPKGEPQGLTRLTYFTLGLTFLIEFSNVMLAVPLLELFEDAVCQAYYAAQLENPVSPGIDLCKAAPVQSELAFIRGWQGFLNGLSALVMALPLGYFAERHSHRATMAYILAGMLAAVLWSVLVGTVAAMPNRLLWLTSVFLLSGGGNYAAEMLLAVVLVNSTSEFNRTRVLYYMYSCMIVTELVGPQISKWCLDHSIWLAFGIGTASLLSCFPVLAVMPESNSAPEEQDEGNHSRPEEHGTWREAWLEISKRLSAVKLLTRSRNICFAIPLFLVGTFRNVSLRAMLQYVSARFDWKLKETNWLITEVALVNLALFFVILPSIIYIVNRNFQPSQQKLNLRIVQVSFAILAAGSAGISFSRTSPQLIGSLGLYALGFGARATLLSLATFWFDKQVRARLYSAILILELVGMLCGEAILQNILSASFHLSRTWMGVPFLFCMGCYLVAFLSSFGIRVDRTPDDDEADAEENTTGPG